MIDRVTPMVYLAGQYGHALLRQALDGDHPPDAELLATVADVAARLAFATCTAIDRVLEENSATDAPPPSADEDIGY
jgi:hypothetical protein